MDESETQKSNANLDNVVSTSFESISMCADNSNASTLTVQQIKDDNTSFAKQNKDNV